VLLSSAADLRRRCVGIALVRSQVAAGFAPSAASPTARPCEAADGGRSVTMVGVGLLRHGPGQLGSWKRAHWLASKQHNYASVADLRGLHGASGAAPTGRFRGGPVRAGDQFTVQPAALSRHPSVSALLEPFRRRSGCGASTRRTAPAPPRSLGPDGGLRAARTHAIRAPWSRRLCPMVWRLISRPGCPVCGHSAARLSGLGLSTSPGVILCSTATMLLRCRIGGPQPAEQRRRLPMSGVASTLDVLAIARDHPGLPFVCSSRGLREPNSAATALLAHQAWRFGAYQIGSACGCMCGPPAMEALLQLPEAPLAGLPGRWPRLYGDGKARSLEPICNASACRGGHGFRAGDLLEECCAACGSWSGAESRV